jgi:hypothetical protein
MAPWVVWANDVRVGIVAPFAGSHVPISEQFFSGGAEQERFCDSATHELSGACSHGGTDSRFVLAGGGAGEQQVGDVDAADEQHRADSSEEHQKRAAAAGGEVRLQADDSSAESYMVRRLAGNGLLHRVHLCRGLRNRDVRPEASYPKVVMVAFDLGQLVRSPAEGDKRLHGASASAVHCVHESRRGQHEARG